MDNEDEDGNENSLLLGLSFGIGAITSLLLSMCGNSRAGYSDYYSYYNFTMDPTIIITMEDIVMVILWRRKSI